MMDQGTNHDLKAMLQDAVMAMQAASASGRDATARIADQATSPALKALLHQGSTHAEAWRERLSRMAGAVGAAEGHAGGNPIVDAIQATADRIVGKVQDPIARDLGIVAGGQLAVHYYISAFGTMAEYARMLGLGEVSEDIRDCLREAKQADARYTEIAAEIGRG